MTEVSELIQKTLDLYHKFPDSDEVPGVTMGHLRGLMAETATLRQQLAEAQSAAMRLVRSNDEYDEDNPMIMREYAASRAAILALKTPTGDTE